MSSRISFYLAWFVVVVGAFAVIFHLDEGGPPRSITARESTAPQPKSPATPRQSPAGGLFAAAPPMPICGRGRRINCVVDGDTIWLSGEKIRLEGIDAPEIVGKCNSETALAARATRRLSEILSSSRIAVTRSGQDRYGRTLARIETNHGEVGDLLVREGLARPWRGRREDWC